jgi:hypothetical protein
MLHKSLRKCQPCQPAPHALWLTSWLPSINWCAKAEAAQTLVLQGGRQPSFRTHLYRPQSVSTIHANLSIASP